jgi:hypothetical protein
MNKNQYDSNQQEDDYGEGEGEDDEDMLIDLD